MKRRTLFKMATSTAVGTVGGLRHTQVPGFAAPDPVLDVVLPAIVIGSGYGGAVSALRLTQAGIETTVIEMGAMWDRHREPHSTVFSTMKEPDERSMWFKDRTDMPFPHILGMDVINKPTPRGPGPLDKVYFDEMAVYLGRAVGGGSVVNGGMAPTPDREFLSEKLPAAVVNDLYATYFDRAREELGIAEPGQDILDSGWYHYSRKSAADARKAGFRVDTIPNVYDWEHFRGELTGMAVPSATDGQIIFGNDHGKKSLDKTYLAKANATGYLRLLTLTEVTDIAWDGEAYRLIVETRDADWNLLDTKVLRTTRLFLAAGVLGTVKLLLRAKKSGGLTGLNDQVGVGFGTNGNHMVARSSWTSTGTTWASGIPVQAINNWADPHAQVLAEIAPVPAGIELFLSLYLAIARTEQRATFTLGADDRLRLDWRAEQARESAAKVYQLFDAINAANWTIYRYDIFGNGTPMSSEFTYHPLGGAVLGQVTDEYGRVKGHRGLYVMDGSLIPGQVGVNPFLAITAIAERNITEIIAADCRDIPAHLPRPYQSIRLQDNEIGEFLGMAPSGSGVVTGAGLEDRYLVASGVGGRALAHAASGHVISVTDTGIVHAPDDGGAGQRFTVAAGSAGSMAVQSLINGNFLTGVGEGRPVVTQTKSRTWQVVNPQPLDADVVDVRTLPIGLVHAVQNVESQLLMNVQGGFSHVGAVIQTWAREPADNSRFRVEQVGEMLRLVNVRSGLAVACVSTDVGSRMIQVAVHDEDPRQLFAVRGNDRHGYFLGDRAGVKVITQRRGSMALTVNENFGMPMQRWTFTDL